MSRECDDVVTVSNSTKATSCTGYVLMNRSRASDNLATRFCGVESISLGRLYNSHCRDSMLCHDSVSHLYILSGCIDCEAFRVSFLDHFQVVVAENVMGVSVTLAAFVCISQGRYHGSINVTQDVGKVTRYIVAPELATLKLTNCRSKLLEVYTSLTFSNFLPVNVLWARLSVATLIVERASARAGLTAAGAGGDRASLGVAGNQGESGVHRFGVVN